MMNFDSPAAIPMLFHNVSPRTCIISKCLTDLKMRKTRASRKMRRNDAAGRKCPNLRARVFHLAQFAGANIRLEWATNRDTVAIEPVYVAIGN